MNVSQVGGQFRQVRLNVGAGSIRIQQRANGKVMPKIMDTRAITIARLVQTNLTRHQ